MKIVKINPKKSLNKSFLKQRPLRIEIELFKSNLIRLLDKVDEIEREENQKNHVRDFLRDTFYKETNEINTKDTKDLVIHLGKTNKDRVGVIIEAKRPGNKSEMLSTGKPNVKAFQELVLYYLRERIEENNIDIKFLIATNVYEWYIFEASYFEKLFYRNKSFVRQYEEWRDGQKVTKDTNLFYNSIAQPFIENIDEEIPCTWFDIRDYEKFLRNTDKEDDKNLIALQKLLSPFFLLKAPYANDSNSMDEKFYKELLHIIGLEEVKDGSKNIIRRKETDRQSGSFIENVLNILITEDTLHKIKDRAVYGQTKDEQLFGIALELSLTWINRVLFLKLLEGLLITYHKESKDYRFLNSEIINDFDELYKLFHQVLTRKIEERTQSNKQKYARVPYLNSSLFEISELEDVALKINSLDNSETIELISTTVLKEEWKNKQKLPALEYLFRFLDAYNFASEGGEDIVEDNKTIINASVLGKVFEKINGYKDGSIFTPGFITMFMSRQALRLAVIQKFNDYFRSEKIAQVSTFIELYNRIEKIDIKTANDIINSLRICDPAVGSGHFLVSVLNELIVIKSELGILVDKNGKRLRNYEIIVDNDELIISDDNGIFAYNYLNKESQRVQETIFAEKQILIENCLFGVDINPNSVKICRLRLWIELLKSSFYKSTGTPNENEANRELETLPNIDINIKCGNSLISRYSLDSDLKKALQKSKWNISTYRLAVMTYRNSKSRDEKREMENLIGEIKNGFETEIQLNDKRFKKLRDLKGDLFTLTNQGVLFDKTQKEKEDWSKKVAGLTAEIQKQEQVIEEIRNNVIYKNAFEWRFEFPEVLNDNGDFVGFDLVIGNPPYIQLQSMGKFADAVAQANYKTFSRTGDIYSLFYEKGNDILKAKGILAFITSNKWMRADYGLNTRKYLVENTNPLMIIDFGMHLIFDNATVLSNVLLLQKDVNANHCLAVRTPNDFDSKTDLHRYFEINNSFLPISENAWVISTKDIQKVKTKVESQGIKLKTWHIKINYGIKTSYNEAFIVDGKTKDFLIENDEKCAEFLMPILRGKDIKSWSPEFADLWVIFIPKGLTIKKNLPKDDVNYIAEAMPRYGNMFYNDAWDWFSQEYPSLANHLMPFMNKADARQDKGDYWWEQRACSYLEEFKKPKIIYPNMTKFLPFVYDEKGYLTNQKCFTITSKEHCLKYLTAFFNSKIFKVCFKDNFPELLGETYELSKVFFEQIPVKQISTDAQKPFDELVDKILIAKSQNQNTAKLEKQIDQLVYNLYDLNDEEIKIVESGK